jgi:hypothetical protein
MKKSKKESELLDKVQKFKEDIDIEIKDPSKRNEPRKGFSQWAISQDGSYWPTFDTSIKVPAGVYEIHSSQNGPYMKRRKFTLSDTVLELPMTISEEILTDMQLFWDMRSKFEKYKMVYKRGILMHGPPGCGKSYLIQNIMKMIVQRDGIVFTCNDEDDVSRWIGFIQTFREIEPDRPIVVIIEDIDNIVQGGHSTLSKLLNVLDGVEQIDNVVYLATTNYIERLQERISNRPSRFDRLYEIGLPDAKVREFFLKHKLHKEDLSKIDLADWIERTDGLTLSHIKEVIVSTMILNRSLDEVLDHFDVMKHPKNSRLHGKQLGFDKKK